MNCWGCRQRGGIYRVHLRLYYCFPDLPTSDYTCQAMTRIKLLLRPLHIHTLNYLLSLLTRLYAVRLQSS